MNKSSTYHIPFSRSKGLTFLECGCVLGSIADAYKDCRYGNVPTHPEVKEVR